MSSCPQAKVRTKLIVLRRYEMIPEWLPVCLHSLKKHRVSLLQSVYQAVAYERMALKNRSAGQGSLTLFDNP